MPYTLPPPLEEILNSSQDQRFVVMTCGIAGSGKSTLAHTLCKQYPNFIRLSIDNYIFTHHGLVGMDFPISQYERYQEEAEDALKVEFRKLLQDATRDVVLDLSFWSREYRDDWRNIVTEETGGHRVSSKVPDVIHDRGRAEHPSSSAAATNIVLVFFDAEESVLWRRIGERREKAGRDGKDADNAAVVTRAVLSKYVRGFERPEDDEGALVVKVD